VYTTNIHTITYCHPTKTACHPGDVVTETVSLYTTVCPIGEYPTPYPGYSKSSQSEPEFSILPFPSLPQPPTPIEPSSTDLGDLLVDPTGQAVGLVPTETAPGSAEDLPESGARGVGSALSLSILVAALFIGAVVVV
jgi:hypothetical protein